MTIRNASNDGLVGESSFTVENILFDQPERHFWMNDDRYKPYLKEFVNRPEYEKRIKKSK